VPHGGVLMEVGRGTGLPLVVRNHVQPCPHPRPGPELPPAFEEGGPPGEWEAPHQAGMWREKEKIEKRVDHERGIAIS